MTELVDDDRLLDLELDVLEGFFKAHVPNIFGEVFVGYLIYVGIMNVYRDCPYSIHLLQIS